MTLTAFHVKPEHVFQALDEATSGTVAEGNTGGGTGMVAHQFKGGTGTASRKLDATAGNYTVGVLVQANYGGRSGLMIAGVPVGREITDLMPKEVPADTGSIIVVIGTDAPLLPHQLKRVVKRAALGIAKNGGIGGNSSGDIFIAFSTANSGAGKEAGVANLQMLPNDRINPIFAATVQATEEAIINAMIGAETMSGVNGNTVYAIPHERLKQVMKKYNRTNEQNPK